MNETQVRYTLETLKKENEVIEVRVIGQKTCSGYFRDIDNLIKQLKGYQGDNIYFVMNGINEACYDRKQQEIIIQSPKNTTSDNDIVSRNWLLIDVDSKRATGVGATDEEKAQSKETALRVFKFLRDVGFYQPVSADSGNGFHLLYRINLSNTTENTVLVQNVLKVLDMFFSTDKAQIDTSVFNASRITKLYGTVARKGRNSKDRPHRESGILKAPNDIKATDISLLQKVAQMLPKPEERTRWNNYGNDSFNLDNFISSHGIKVKSIDSYSGGTKYVLENCVFDPSHKGKDAAIFKLDNGAIGYKCFHNSCSGYHWQDVRKKFEPNAYERQYENPYRQTKKEYTPQPEQTEKGGKFLSLSEIKAVDRSKIVSIESGFTELDRKIVGFNKGEVTLWSGKNGSGKSSVINHLCLNAAQKNFRSIIYSGELNAPRMKQWLQLQAAGRQFTKPTQYENLYFVPKQTGDLIDKWLKDKILIYNNEYGNDFKQLFTDIKQQVDKAHCDILVLDNLMALSLLTLDGDKYQQQTAAIQSIMGFAKENNIHVHIIAHPRKSVSYLRKEDISGTADLTNAVDNVAIVHRVNKDFIRATKEYFGEAEASQFHKFNNVIEVVKNRDLGVQDYMVGIYYEIESKRFLNNPFDNPLYDWQENSYQHYYEPIKQNEDFLNQSEEVTKILTELPF